MITANATKGFVGYPKLRFLDRIDLASAQLERSAAFPFDAAPAVLLTGSASAGPLLSVFHAGRADDSFAQPVVGFLDPVSLRLVAPRAFHPERKWGMSILQAHAQKDSSPIPKRLRVDSVDPRATQLEHYEDFPFPANEVHTPVLAATGFASGNQAEYRASSSGDLFCHAGRFPNRNLALAMRGDVVDVFETRIDGGELLPSAAGRSFFTLSGRFDLAGSALGRFTKASRFDLARSALPRMLGADQILSVVTSPDPSYYLLVRSSASHAMPVHEIYSAASDSRLLVINGLDEMQDLRGNELTLHERYHLVPSAGLIVTIPVENDRLVVRRLDILRDLHRLGVDEIVVTSSPVVRAIAGEPFRHRVEAYAKGGATFERSVGPEKMSVSLEGELRWNVPDEAAGQEAVAVVAVRSPSGQTALHAVHILIRKRR